MTIFFKYLYLWGSLFGLLVYLFLFITRFDLRKRMLAMGIPTGLLCVLMELSFLGDYWHPPYVLQFGIFGGLEDFIFGFAAGGIGSVLYDFIFHKHIRKIEHSHYWIIPYVVLSQFLSLFIFNYLLKVNSIYASIIGFIFPVVAMYFFRKDLLQEIIISSILAGVVLFTIEAFFLLFAPQYLTDYFLLYKKVYLILGITPVTELMWGMAFGAVIAPLHDFAMGTRPVR